MGTSLGKHKMRLSKSILGAQACEMRAWTKFEPIKLTQPTCKVDEVPHFSFSFYPSTDLYDSFG